MQEGDKNVPMPSKKQEQETAHDVAHSANFIAGGLVSAMSKMFVYPMETKVLLIAVGESAKDPLRLWHGVLVKGMENFLYNGLLWLLKELLRAPPPDPAFPERRPPVTFIQAFGASCISILVAHPISNIVVAMQASLRNTAQKPISALAATKAIMRIDGIGGFFKGWELSILLRVGCAMTFVVYDFVRMWIARVVGDDISNFIAGLLGRLTEVFCNQPLKTLRSRLQLGQAMLPSLKPSEAIRLWDGVGTVVVADAMKIGIRFLLIERLRSVLQWVLCRRKQLQRNPVIKGEVKDAETEQEKLMGA